MTVCQLGIEVRRLALAHEVGKVLGELLCLVSGALRLVPEH